MGFLLLLILYLYKSNLFEPLKCNIVFILIYGGILAIIFIIPDGITLEQQGDNPYLTSVYSFSFTTFVVCFLLISVALSLWLTKKTYETFKITDLRKRLRCFILGNCILYYSPIVICIVNYLNNPLIRLIFAFTLPLMFVGVILVYYGIKSI
jgi:hypothetical protein